MLKITDLTKVFGNFKAVDNVSLEILAGTIYGFIGHNGAGKTTTLKSIAGILSIEYGEILVDGYSVRDNSLVTKSKIAYIPDNPDLYDYMTGNQYLQFICDIYKIDKNKRSALIDSFSARLKIDHALNESLSSYSHGMKQKIAIVSAFIHEPKLIIMDEPFVGLDPQTTKTFKEMMREFCDCGNAIFFSTHVLEVAEKLCDEIAIIKQGKIVVSGKTKDIIGTTSLEDYFLELVDND